MKTEEKKMSSKEKEVEGQKEGKKGGREGRGSWGPLSGLPGPSSLSSL